MLRTLRAVDFRCFESLALEVPASGAVFTGRNAQGKTSVLEAVCLLIRLHSPRTARMSTLARIDGAGGFGLAGEAWNCERRVDWRSRQPMDFRVDGETRASQGAYLEDGGLLVWMGNDDIEMVRGGGETRRRYLDFIGSQVAPDYRRALARYRRALKARNFLLKDPARREAEIRSYEGVMVEAAAVLRSVRVSVSERLAPAVAERQEGIAGHPEKLELEYRAEGGMDLAAAFEQARERELRQRRSLVGPHRDELIFRLNGLDAGTYGSEGQQRTLALALKLAQGTVLAETRGVQPIWLIDDVFGELDVARRNAVMKALPGDAQRLITTTHLDWLEESPDLAKLRRFRVTAGRVE
ncbi:DNA replication/repair protein RecF [Haloferula sp. A504]|uniref:DNA replication/repair protein RecF n=1 Tax=Haloferula sp. A504 TaxID=3373601 RepID=UPI0031BC0DCF|nr:DNA replication and repair protein RecF [Verrucomicrobiaceae bacterium E54]